MPTVPHGQNQWRTCFDVVQHQFVARDAPGVAGWAELLEIRGEIPEGVLRFAICFFASQGGVRFSPFRKLSEAKSAFVVVEKDWVPDDYDMAYLMKQPGFLDIIPCGPAMPWFYAWKFEDVQGLLAHPGYEARRASQG